jgi:hypothetical protein
MRFKSKRWGQFFQFLLGLLASIAVTGGFAGLVFLLASHLIDPSLIVSLWVAEVPLAYLLYYLLGERRRSKAQRFNDALARVQAIREYGHLRVYRRIADFGNWNVYKYPTLEYYVVNTNSKKAYWAPEFVHELAEGEVIHVEKFKEDEVYKAMSDEGIELTKREATIQELGLATDFRKPSA